MPPKDGDLSVERVEQCPGILGLWGPVAMKDNKDGDEDFPLLRLATLQVPGGIAYSHPEKEEALADGLESVTSSNNP
jgi:hypothetical protein